MPLTTQITSFQAKTSAEAPYTTDFSGLLSVVEPFTGLKAQTIQIQVYNDATGWQNVSSGTTDDNGVFHITIIWGDFTGTQLVRANYSGNFTFKPSISPLIKVAVGVPDDTNLLLYLGIGAVAVLGLYFILRRSL